MDIISRIVQKITGQKPHAKPVREKTGIKIELGEGVDRRVLYELPGAKINSPSVAFFILPKSGTVMINGIIRKLAREVGLVNSGLDGLFFKHAIPRSKIPRSASAIFVDRGYCYGFSMAPTEYDIPILGSVPTLVHVRDIRDVLVSRYFSTRNSHPLPGALLDGKADEGALAGFNATRERLQNVELDEGVCLLAALEGDNYRRFFAIAKNFQAKTSRYEDMVYNKLEWTKQICDYFGWRLPQELLERVVKPFDVFPDGERPDQHVRQVHPGNFKKKLKPETIKKIDEMFALEQEFFGYPPFQA